MAMWRVLRPVIQSFFTHKHNEWDDYESSQPPFPLSALIQGTEADSWPLMYRIEVTTPSGTFIVKRRYKEFLQLKQTLKVDLRFFEFPPGRVYVTSWGLIYRKRQLNHFLAYLCARNLSTADREKFFLFLGLNTKGTASGKSPPSPPLSPEAKRPESDGGYCGAPDCWQSLPCPFHSSDVAEEKKADASQEASQEREEEADDELESAPPGGESELVENFEAPAAEPAGETPMFPQFEHAPKGIRLVQDVTYLIDSKEDHHRMDIYMPSAPENSTQTWPVVIHVHGGGWVRGGRKIGFYGAPSMCRAYAQRGFVAVAVSYRLGKAPFHTSDCNAAIRWVLANIGAYGGQPQNIFLSGHSAGGNIVTLMGLSSELGLPSTTFRGIVSVSGVYNLSGPMNKGWKNRVFRNRYILSTFGKDTNNIIRHSPVALVRMHCGMHPLERCKWREDTPDCAPGQAVFGDIQPAVKSELPFLVLSAADDLGLEKDAVDFVVHLKLMGMDVQYDSVGESNHPNICWSDVTHLKITNWIRSVLARSP